MAENPWFAFYPADYLADTRQLTVPEHGAYMLLLCETYQRGGKLVCNCNANASYLHTRLHRVCSAFADAEREAVEHVLSVYWTYEDGAHIHRRVLKELAKRADISAERSGAARKRWDSERDAKASAIALQKQCYPQPQSQLHPQSQPEAVVDNQHTASGNTHSQRPSVREGPPQESTGIACGENPAPGNSDSGQPPGPVHTYIGPDDLVPIWEAWCHGAGQLLGGDPIPWTGRRLKQYEPAMAIAERHPRPTPEAVTAAAKAYSGSLSPGIVPSFQNFAADFERYAAASQNGGGNGRARESPTQARERRNLENLASVLSQLGGSEKTGA